MFVDRNSVIVIKGGELQRTSLFKCVVKRSLEWGKPPHWIVEPYGRVDCCRLGRWYHSQRHDHVWSLSEFPSDSMAGPATDLIANVRFLTITTDASTALLVHPKAVEVILCCSRKLSTEYERCYRAVSGYTLTCLPLYSFSVSFLTPDLSIAALHAI